MPEAVPALIPYVCPKCHRHLVDAPRGASVSCPACGVWATAPAERSKAPARSSRSTSVHPEASDTPG